MLIPVTMETGLGIVSLLQVHHSISSLTQLCQRLQQTHLVKGAGGVRALPTQRSVAPHTVSFSLPLSPPLSLAVRTTSSLHR